MASVSGGQHVSRVRLLYKLILKLHRGMPIELRAMGDQYVKDEFKRHKDCQPQFVGPFMNEWTNYAIILAKQIGDKKQRGQYGGQLPTDKLNALSDEQVYQLYELFQETQKPVDPDNPLGYNPSAANTSSQGS